MSVSSITATPIAFRTLPPPPIVYQNNTLQQSNGAQQGERPHHPREGSSRLSGVVSADAGQAINTPGSLLDTVV